jgi:hypothetical protein
MSNTMNSIEQNESRDQFPYAQYRDVYHDSFINDLAKDFNLDESDPFTLERLYEIPFRFHLARRVHSDDSIKETRKEYETLAKRLTLFQDQMHRLDGWGLDSELWEGAKMLPSFDPDLVSRDYPSFIYKDSIAYRFELQRYLNFLQLGLDQTLKRVKSSGGRPRDEGLHLAVRYVSNYWVYDLKREYKFDYHKGSGLSEAFEFTNRLIQQIEKIDERKIVTAMRTVVRENREFDERMMDGFDDDLFSSQ